MSRYNIDYKYKSDDTIIIEAVEFNGYNVGQVHDFLKSRLLNSVIRMYLEIMADNKIILTIINKDDSYVVTPNNYIIINDNRSIEILSYSDFHSKFTKYNYDMASDNDSYFDLGL